MAETLTRRPEANNKAGDNPFSKIFKDKTFLELSGIADVLHVVTELGNHLSPVSPKLSRRLGGAAARSAQNPEQN